ncbi:hypothetical protein [Candidatus Nitrospira allomarina]|jgi:hypothetical protein|uniref:Uncharacterized protein n=1 Tax=Candidatus Nitrospira allomarina TaxID=3020900 RepID=A0AA96GFX9_9BACT|nr:hypothetical protein [Candidatus Nitrospira allomarina]WNM59375.1 hypothetical protein PP769_06325 [Candidatus Nitrospira allomarina]
MTAQKVPEKHTQITMKFPAAQPSDHTDRRSFPYPIEMLHKSRSRIGEKEMFILTEGKQILPYGRGKKGRTLNPINWPLTALIIRLNEKVVLRWGQWGTEATM